MQQQITEALLRGILKSRDLNEETGIPRPNILLVILYYFFILSLRRFFPFTPASVFPLSFFLLWFHPPWLLNSRMMLYFLATSFSINAWLIYLWNLNIYLAILKININHDLKLKYELITWCSFLFKNIEHVEKTIDIPKHYIHQSLPANGIADT